jgi:hypothetical protein
MMLRKPATVHTVIEPWHLRRMRDEAFAVIAAMNEADRSATGALEVARLMLGWAEYLSKREMTWAVRQAWGRAATALRELIPNVEAAAEGEGGTVH